MPLITHAADTSLPLPERGGLPASVHVFSDKELLALNMALITGRPLLVRGEPGSGKSQLARAAAEALGWPFVRTVADARTEASDLLWHYDTVARLANAQILHAMGIRDEAAATNALAPDKFVKPGALWAALDWKSARRTKVATPKQWSPGDGVVLLIDEIDKADSSVPSGLLSALGEGTFETPGGRTISCHGVAPLVVVTTNEDRVLPAAFVRRCLVLQIDLPDSDAKPLAKWLRQRATPHFPTSPGTSAEDTEARNNLFEIAAGYLHKRRKAARDQGIPPPGLAEYIDLLQAVHQWPNLNSWAEREDKLKKLLCYVLDKHPQEHG